MSETRKLAAILVSDVVGYSRLAGSGEDRILARLRTLRSDLIDPTIAVTSRPHRQARRVAKSTGWLPSGLTLESDWEPWLRPLHELALSEVDQVPRSRRAAEPLRLLHCRS
jgi:hypothetical protein